MNIYQLKISLNDAKPPIWRSILVESTVLMPDLHKIIQTTMGWTNSHLHQFEWNGQVYGDPILLEDLDYENYNEIALNTLLKAENDSISYLYDFGDGWEHQVELEKVLPKEPNRLYPVCIAGENACPPEDCGGIGGYQALLEIMSDPSHEEHEEMTDWLGDEFDPTEFDKEEVSETLQSDNFGVYRWEDEE